MGDQGIENLIELLSCNFILADPEEPETISGLLPILKQIHGNCIKQSLKDAAQKVLKARRTIDGILAGPPGDANQKMTGLSELISELSLSVQQPKEAGRVANTIPDPEQETIEPETIEQRIESDPKKISQDDIPILMDFISETRENLDAIEVCLVGLEKDPGNIDMINDIFRPFHTIKGVSGFLSLKKINRLAHSTENLLDSARSSDLLINDTAVDVILESVDILKQLMARVQLSVETGFWQSDDDMDADSLIKKIQTLHSDMTESTQKPLGEILMEKGAVDREGLDQALEMQKNCPDKKIGEILVQEKKTAPKEVAAALMEQQVSKTPVDSQIKVSAQKLDDLVDYTGELVIAQSMLRQQSSGNPVLNQSVAHMGQIVSHMQTIAMSMRMIPIKTTFTKMIRLVRDLSQKSGKEVVLTMQGEDTEVDRNVVDALYEPMVHMIRNAVDHGIEPVSNRKNRGKPPQGHIILRAYHKGGHMMIEIEDDGKGLDKDKILEKAKSRGLISGNDPMTDAQVYDLILAPGFSTADEITDVSGRGVGMDVVREVIERFKGHLNIESQKWAGTRFTINLPLTLAIIDGMLVGFEDDDYVIPTLGIQKVFKPDRDNCFTVEGKGEVVRDKDGLIPVVRLNDVFNTDSQRRPVWDSLVVVVESKDEKRALLIDRLLGKDEYVIKRLGSQFENIESLAGGAILADGRVGLILDINGLFKSVGQR